MKNLKKIIVTPVYEDVEASSKLFQEIALELGNEVYIVAVDDGSVKQPLDISAIESAGLEGVVVKLKRNVGHQKAISIGLSYAAELVQPGQQVVVMDSDGEDVPVSIKELVQPLHSEDVDVVVAQRKSRVETFKFKAFYLVYKFVFQLLTGKKISFGNFMAFKYDAVKRVATMQELGIHVAATVLSSKLRIHTLPLDRGPRYAGKSKMNFVSLALHGFRAVMIFAEDVLVRVGIASTIVAMLSLVGGLIALLLKVFEFATPGWFSIALGVLLLVFIQTGTITLMMLMLVGLLRGNAGIASDYKEYIKEVIHAK